MKILDIIVKKRDKFELSENEIKYFIDGYVSAEISDYQASALLMAIFLNGMNEKEIFFLTKTMANSGKIINLDKISGIKADKHSTGGVGDKTSLIVLPIVAACGVKVAKMSGRGLGHTGGTIDKLESIPKFRTSLSDEKFLEIVDRIGISIIGQTNEIVPADKKIYALRDAIAAVESIPLIASSIMSKKIAGGADVILLDVKFGHGAFMKKPIDAVKLAKIMVKIGEKFGKKTMALITDMNQPLGSAIGNSLEIEEAGNILRKNSQSNLTELCKIIAANILYLAKKGTIFECKKMVVNALKSGAAYEKFNEFVSAHGGDLPQFESELSKVKFCCEYCAKSEGFINSIDAEKCGKIALLLGAGRTKKDDYIDHTAGIKLLKKSGDYVKSNEIIAKFYSNSTNIFSNTKKIFESAVIINNFKPKRNKLVYKKIVSF